VLEVQAFVSILKQVLSVDPEGFILAHFASAFSIKRLIASERGCSISPA
jgi:hypothetical protein